MKEIWDNVWLSQIFSLTLHPETTKHLSYEEEL